MKIAVFGDSYSEKVSIPTQPSWFELLEEHGHQVTSFGSGGSSVLYSAMLLNKHAENFDFLIWAVTNPTRISVVIDESPYTLHFTDIGIHNPHHFKKETADKINAADDYFKHLMEFDEQDLIATALVQFMQSKYKNLMIIPCFLDPLRTDFNLFDLCAKEIDYYFPNVDYQEFFQNYTDLRRCHFSIENNRILSNIIAENLYPGVFQTSYDNFVNPSADKEFYFSKKHK